MMREQSILLIEDLDSDRTLLLGAVVKAPFSASIRTVNDGEAAIDYLKGEGVYSDRSRNPLPVVILLDLNIPKVNGFGVLVWLHSQPKLKRIPVIIWTGSSRVEDVERAYDLGAAGYLVKPSSVEELRTMVLRLRDWLEINRFPVSK
jgi:CheY-like chemotaxis protein